MIGELVRYSDRRHRGYIKGDGVLLFVHVSEFARAGITPRVGMTLKFESGTHEGKEVAIRLAEVNG